ncbi:MAG: hypothetical protein JW821_06810, partial [Deltaproteobacteria bacterium]|nr:hypothetical protein [Deltaproteobacteria bacterium]
RPQLHVERAIYMGDSFQSPRSARLILAYRMVTDKTRKRSLFCNLCNLRLFLVFLSEQKGKDELAEDYAGTAQLPA